ncbi:MAG: hypothetical protein JSV56_09985 [Methanomassiliicoccales archaeon]|nr:MAG: hypothetical protein JSV56_09985 [Methanomassiliicoccales archaeon]
MSIRNFLVLLIGLLFASSFTLGTALAGDETNPEVDDGLGDTGDSTRQFQDIDSAWFDETNTSVIVSMKMAGPPPSVQSLLNEDITPFDYEVYFEVEGTNYAACVIIEYAASLGGSVVEGGVYNLQDSWNWELREVNYALGTDIIQSETPIGGVSGIYRSQNVVLEWTLNKEDIGIGEDFAGRGKELVNTWAAVWDATENPANSQRNPNNQAWDYANTNTNPGKNYRITGRGGVDYNIIFSIDDDEVETYGGTAAEFIVRVENNGTHKFNVDFFPREYDEKWLVELNPNSTVITKGASITLKVTVTPPKDVVNGTVLVLVIEGNIHEIEGNGTVPVQPPITLRTVALTPPGESDEGGWWPDFIETLRENLAIIAGAIAVVAIAIIILVVLVRR